MYDFILELLSTLFRHGFSVSSAVAIVFLLLRQRKIKKRLSKFFPWMFGDDNDVKAYMGNQLVIMENQQRIMFALGVEVCANGPTMKSEEPARKNSNMLLGLSRVVMIPVSRLRRKRMKTIVIDAGHGGRDPGATGTKHEKEFALTMALKLEKRLQGSDVAAVLTRQKDVYLELSRRAQIANNLKADAFISIHANASNGSASGTETLYTRPDSKPFAEVLQKHLAQATGLRDRGVKEKNLAVTRETKMPAALIEVGFIDNKDDEAKLFDPAFQDKVIEALAKCILEYLGAKDRPVQYDVPYPEMNVIVHAHEEQEFTGYNINGSTWLPSRPVGELLGHEIDYKKSKVTINGTAAETKLINGLGYVKARELADITGARVFWDKATPTRVDIFKGE